MYDITIIGTIHTENGMCNQNSLYRILEEINPDVIFEELTHDFCELYYESEEFEKYYWNYYMQNRKHLELQLEVNCIRKYKQNYFVKIVPVDIDNRQVVAEYGEELAFDFNLFYNNEDYIRLINQRDISISQHGFQFLNSPIYLELIAEKERAESLVIEQQNDKEELQKKYRLFRTWQIDNREFAMLNNIYNYSKENSYNRAVFLIGADHRVSLLQKIKEYNKLQELKLNWKNY